MNETNADFGGLKGPGGYKPFDYPLPPEIAAKIGDERPTIHLITGPGGICLCGTDQKTCTEIVETMQSARIAELERRVEELTEENVRLMRGLEDKAGTVGKALIIAGTLGLDASATAEDVFIRAQKAAKAESELSQLRAEVERLTKVLTRANPPPERAYECLTLLDSAGLGKPGAPHGNTLTGMTHEAVELIATLRAQLAEREEDRALLDWLEANWEFVFQRVSSPGWFYFDQTQQLRMPAKSLRAAIRAARAQPEDGK